MNDDELERELKQRERLYGGRGERGEQQRKDTRPIRMEDRIEADRQVRPEYDGPIRDEADRQELEDFFRELVSSYTNFPANLKLELKQSYRSWVLMVEPDVCDYAIVCGKAGRNFNALKTLVNAIGERRSMEIEMLLEGPPPDDKQHIRKQLPYKINPQWTPEGIQWIVGKTLRMAGLGHVQLRVAKNKVVNKDNPFDDQSFYWFIGTRSNREAMQVMALGQLMESISAAQGQRLVPRFRERALEKAS